MNPTDSFIYPFSDELEERYIFQVYHGGITTKMLSNEYHRLVNDTLMMAVIIGMDGYADDVLVALSKFNITTPKAKAYNKFKGNIYNFSAAKQYHQVKEMSAFINNKGERSTFESFKSKAKKVFKTYNEGYLKTEYITAVGQAQSAREWIDAEERQEQFPLITYRTQRDARVRDEHAILDGITLPVGHKFWNTYAPKNGWRCRCFIVSKTSRSKVTDLKSVDLSELKDKKKFPESFRGNPGKDGLIFNPKKHPYFKK